MPINMMTSCQKDDPIEIINPEPSPNFDPSDPDDTDDPDRPDSPDHSEDPDDTTNQDNPNFQASEITPTEYILSYQDEGVTYQMIRVDAPSDAPFWSFCMIGTEIPINRIVKFGRHFISQLDNGDQIAEVR